MKPRQIGGELLALRRRLGKSDIAVGPDEIGGTLLEAGSGRPRGPREDVQRQIEPRQVSLSDTGLPP